MVQFRTEHDCNCETCQQNGVAISCSGSFVGGWTCLCNCHNDEAYKAQRIEERRKQLDEILRSINKC